MTDDNRALIVALGELAVLNRITGALIRRLRAKGALGEEDIASIKDQVQLELEEQLHDPAGPGAPAVDRMRDRLEKLLPYRE